MKNVWRALRWFRPEWPSIVLAFVFLLAGVFIGMLKPWPLALMVDNVLGDKPWPEWLQSWVKDETPGYILAALGGLILVFHAGQGMMVALQNFLSIRVGLQGLARVRLEIFEHLQRLSLRYYMSMNQGDIIYRASWDTYAFQTLFQQGLFSFFTAIFSLVVMLVVMWQLNPALTWAAMASVPFLMAAMIFFGRQMNKRSMAAHQADSQVTTFLQQGIVALPLTQSYTREEVEARHFKQKALTALQKRIEQHGWEVSYWLVIALIFGFGTAAVAWYGGQLVLQQRLSLGELLIFLAYLAQFYDPLNQLSNVSSTVSNALASTLRVWQILNTDEEVRDKAGARPVVRTPVATPANPAPLVLQGHLEFDQVAFGYLPGQQVLRGVSFKLEDSQSLAIIGPSGAGKTTLLQMLPRFYDPAQGAVKLDGVDLRDLKLKDLRQNVGLVLQEPILLPATIAENIAYGRPGASREEIIAAANAANAAQFIERLPQQYDTLVGEGAARLSVGEKQRLNLARAFLKDPPILLLDEPTSALDAESEALVMASLQRLMQGRTTLIVAHRLSTIRNVDKILVLEQGQVVDFGAPDELISRGGYYARMLANR